MSQAVPTHGVRAASEPPKPACPLKWRYIEALEALIDGGSTAQQRVMPGFFVFLIHSSHRCSNGQQTRRLRLTDVAVMGESLLKGKRTYTKRAATREGLTQRLGSHVI